MSVKNQTVTYIRFDNVKQLKDLKIKAIKMDMDFRELMIKGALKYTNEDRVEDLNSTIKNLSGERRRSQKKEK